MMRKLFPVILVAGLSACASSGTQQSSSDSATRGGGASSGNAAACDAQPVQSHLGQTYSESLANTLRSSANAEQVRVLKPGQVMTMEYLPTRLNVILESDGSISALRCG